MVFGDCAADLHVSVFESLKITKGSLVILEDDGSVSNFESLVVTGNLLLRQRSELGPLQHKI